MRKSSGVASFSILVATLAFPTGTLSSPQFHLAPETPPEPFLLSAQVVPGRNQVLIRVWPAIDLTHLTQSPHIGGENRPSAVGQHTVSAPLMRTRNQPAGSTAIVIRGGQTLWNLARSYGLTVEEIVEANGLENPDMVFAGHQLRIPAPSRTKSQSRVRSVLPKAPAGITYGFLWPTRGSLTSRFGWRWSRHHNGIDIAALFGAAIHAAKSGRVIHAGWYSGYGRTVIIDHGEGVTSVYGHASRLLVVAGQHVHAGQEIARVGSTGYSRGPHLHFEIRIDRRPVDPLPTVQPEPPHQVAFQRDSTAPQQEQQKVRYHVQVGAYRLRENAKARVEQIRRFGFVVSITRSKNLYTVWVGSFPDRTAADRLVEEFRGRGFEAFVTQ